LSSPWACSLAGKLLKEFRPFSAGAHGVSHLRLLDLNYDGILDLLVTEDRQGLVFARRDFPFRFPHPGAYSSSGGCV
jgi:hypothetical protein